LCSHEFFDRRWRRLTSSSVDGSVTRARWSRSRGRSAVMYAGASSNSFEHLFHEIGLGRFVLWLNDDDATRQLLRRPRLERAIGVIYRPETERISHYFEAALPDQFDVVIHVDRTTALEPLERWAYEEPDVSETYPFGV
jgi:erythromycin esterase-like protein